jgi:small conductance mechanosensitive channel
LTTNKNLCVIVFIIYFTKNRKWNIIFSSKKILAKIFFLGNFMTWEEVWASIKAWITSEALWNSIAKVLIAIVVLIVSFKIINAISRKIEKKGGQKNADKTVMKTLAYIFKLGMKIVIAICLVGFVGIDTSGLTALVTSLGVCIGLAVNGALSNLAGGIMIILTRPFKIDDYVEAQGVSGTVEDIRMVCTRVRTPDNKVVYIPNGALANGNIINYSEKTERRIDLVFSLDPACDYELAMRLVRDTCLADEGILQTPEVLVTVQENSEIYLKILARVWVKSEKYWDVYYRIIASTRHALNEYGIQIPRERLDVVVKREE